MNKYLLLLFSGLIVLSSCGKELKTHVVENSGHAQGTTYQIKYLVDSNQNYGKEIESILDSIDHSMSTYRENSIISIVNKGGIWVEVDSLFIGVLTRALEIAKESEGDFDPTVGPLIRIWGFGFDEIKKDISAENIDRIKELTGYEHVEVNGNKVRIPKGFELDFNAIAPGYTSDVIASFLETKGITNYMVEVGGEIRARGKNEKNSVWRIGVDKPQTVIDSQERFEFIIELKEAGLATSGNYRKFWVDDETGIKYAHTINPHKGSPALNKLLSATIIAPTAIDADAYATVCLVKGVEACKEFLATKPNLEGYLVFTDSNDEWEVYFTEGFQKYLVAEFRQQKD
ncbi:MAG: FAD:protein FMN transferase [Balneolaceae bacterium]